MFSDSSADTFSTPSHHAAGPSTRRPPHANNNTNKRKFAEPALQAEFERDPVATFRGLRRQARRLLNEGNRIRAGTQDLRLQAEWFASYPEKQENIYRLADELDEGMLERVSRLEDILPRLKEHQARYKAVRKAQRAAAKARGESQG
eukprot:TRINITY_DN10190_c0_g1_i2.p1 TRINITY_DN10190_c0_g1~~TRINITY_DN10190_c0_g1_i2.p1  ORF type:complete len:158 (-),score=31.54 TRINITY_DN10190_c0_g1_i2:37-477(-)